LRVRWLLFRRAIEVGNVGPMPPTCRDWVTGAATHAVCSKHGDVALEMNARASS